MKQVRIVFDEESADTEVPDAKKIASQLRVDLQEEPQAQFVEPVTAILIGGGALLLGKFIVDLMEKMKGGVLIDLRPTATPLVTRKKDIPYGWATVIAADGSVEIEVHDAPKDAAERLLSEIIEGALKTAKEVAAAATERLGADKVKSS